MNARERFLRIMDGDTSIRTLKWEFGYWAGTLKRWENEGLGVNKNVVTDENDYEETCTGGGIPSPELEHPIDYDVADKMDFDKGLIRVPVEHWYYPHFEPEVIEESKDSIIMIDDEGITKEVRKGGGSMPRYISFPVQDDKDFEEIKNRLSLDTEGRFPENWDKIAETLNNRDYPLAIGGKPFGFFGSLRELMGFENCMLAFYDNPDLIKKILDYLLSFWTGLYEKILADITVDYALIWEDMSYIAGPMISPAMFKEIMIPYYKKITSLFKAKGIKSIFVDTDGQCTSLIAPLIEGGVTGMLPFEGQAGMDVAKVAKDFPELSMMGGIDKKLLINDDSDGLKKVLEEKVPLVLKRGRYIPFIDHLVPPDVSWNKFVSYRTHLNEVIERCIW